MGHLGGGGDDLDGVAAPQLMLERDHLAVDLGPDAVVATVFSDSNKKYLSTDLLRPEPVREDYLSPHVQVTGFRAFMRVCSFCA